MSSNSKLFSFIFLTVRASANNPKAKNFLPNLLSSIKNGSSKLFPLKEDQWDIGTLRSESGSFIAKNIANSYYQVHSQSVIPYPPNPYPSLILKDEKGNKKVTINGLENAYITSFDNYNYNESTDTITADLNMQFNYWTNNSDKLSTNQKVGSLGLDTPFIMTQLLCNSKSQNDKECADPSQNPITIKGEGTFTSEISQFNFITKIAITVKPKRKGLNFLITDLKLINTGKNAPKFKNIKAQVFDSPYQDTIQNLIKSFMTQPEASSAVFSQMQSSLNSPETVKTISNTLSNQINNFLNLRLGAVSGQLPSDSNQPDRNMVDMYLFDRIRYSLNNPSSIWFVPFLLSKYKNNTLNSIKFQDINLGDNLKSQGFYDAKLKNIIVSGLPNALSPSDTMILAPPSLHIEFLLGAVGVHTKVDLTFTAKQKLPISIGFGYGTVKMDLHITLNKATLSAVVTPSGDTANDLKIKFDSINFSIPEPKDFIVKVSGVSCPGIIEGHLNNKAFQEKITTAVNNNFKQTLETISNEATKLITTLLNKQLGGDKT